MLCLSQIDSTTYQVATPQPETYTACTAILASPTDFSNQIFNISAAEGLQLSAAIVAVWAIGFVVRMGIRATNIDEKETS